MTFPAERSLRIRAQPAQSNGQIGPQLTNGQYCGFLASLVAES